ncbi:MAG: hypothetical protein P8O05_02265 [Flavobacteriales bacterium]|nr:hypothetical protein [Flavobacteriales bacterium]
MAFLEQFKSKAGNYFLQKLDSSDRNRKGCTLNEAKSVALLYRDHDEAHYKQIKSLVKSLHADFGIQRVCALGFVNSNAKQLPIYQAQKLEYMYFTKDDLNWHMKPKVNLMNFLHEEFDVLIDLTLAPSLPLQFIIKSSKASMKVGNSLTQNETDLDFILEVDENVSLDEYWRQVVFYLTNLKIK